MVLAGIKRIKSERFSVVRKYRRIIKTEKSKLQPHIFGLLAFLFLFVISILSFVVSVVLDIKLHIFWFIYVLCFLSFILYIILFKRQNEVSTFEIEKMSRKAEKLSKKLLRLFDDKWLTDVLKLSNQTRYGYEMPLVYCWVSDDLLNGFIAIENIANYERMNKQNYEQKISGVFAGKYKRYAVVSSSLSVSDTYVLFYFEDMQTSQRLHIFDDKIDSFVSENKHEIRLSKDLVWKSDEVPHLSIIARTRSGKSVLAGRYMARLMLLQGWQVEYNSAKRDIYVSNFNGKSEPYEIVERAEYWCKVMLSRLDEINLFRKEKYLDIENMNDIALFFDELGNLNAELEQDKTLKKRWEVAINKLTATGASAGIHVIAISQFGTKEGFLPSVARVNCSDAVIMLGMAADSADERRYLMPGFADMPKRAYGKGQGVARFLSSGKKWEEPHYFEAPWFD